MRESLNYYNLSKIYFSILFTALFFFITTFILMKVFNHEEASIGNYLSFATLVVTLLAIYLAIKSYYHLKQEKVESDRKEALGFLNALIEEININLSIMNSLINEINTNKVWIKCYNYYSEKINKKNEPMYHRITDDMNECLENKKIHANELLDLIFEDLYDKSLSLFFTDQVEKTGVYKLENDEWIFRYRIFENKEKHISYIYNFMDMKKKLTNKIKLDEIAISHFLSTGKVVAWVKKDKYLSRVYNNLSHLRFGIRRYNETVNSFNSMGIDKRQFSILIFEYIKWTHFLLIFTLLDILERYKDERDVFINQTYVNGIYKFIDK